MGLFETRTTADGRELSRSECRLLDRAEVAEGESTISTSLYNFVLGGTIAYGLLMNAMIVWFCQDAIIDFVVSSKVGYWTLLIGYFVLGFIGVIMAQKSKSALISFIGYNLLVLPLGAILALYVSVFPPMLVAKAMLLTGFITLFMMGIGSAFPQFFARLGTTLVIALIATLLVEVLSVFIFGYSGTLFDYIFVLIFSLYIGYDFSRSQAYAKTLDNAVDSAVDIYLDIVNLFIRILAILGKRN